MHSQYHEQITNNPHNEPAGQRRVGVTVHALEVAIISIQEYNSGLFLLPLMSEMCSVQLATI